MRAGKLRHVGTLQSRVETPDPSTGALVVTWPTFEADVRADIRFLGGLETLKADAVTAISKASIRIRYRPGVVETMRFVETDGKTFDINNISPDDTGRRWLDLACTTGANQG
ncbi:phage head closure protein [Variovorax saccharolyticus]|uniref:phage head closure protein n=1 Tax=Variovorax saccharolyticus TaxID=3053516 RepID=UPI002576AED7|nr:phage head closure protein [Variovorax sp. J31P216]MDM0024080.1 phage head closure protein [Variovorax sp. J31P216]